MGKIKNLVMFSEHFNVDRKMLFDMGVFNPILNLDTRLFIDPILLKTSKHSFIKEDAVIEYNKYFATIISLLSNSEQKDDYAWKTALLQLPEKEIDGTCLGYGTNSISGRRMDDKVKLSLISTANEIIKLGIKDSELFSILPLFNKGIGPDTISDITTKAIHKSLLTFSATKAKELNIPTVKTEIDGEAFDVIPNPLRKKSHILLLPNDILRHLPVVNDWEDIANAASFNHDLRCRVNRLLGDLFRQKTKEAKNRYIASLISNKDVISDLVRIVKGHKGKAYDQRIDNDRIVVWEKASELISKEPCEKLLFDNSAKGLEQVVAKIIERFQFLIEEKGLNKLLWKEDKKGRCREGVPQLIFHAVALLYCQANNIDVSPETDTGTGLIDFKFSKGYNNKIVVELKYSDNPNLIHGLEVQLMQYLKSEQADMGYYVVLDVGKLGIKPRKLQEINNNLVMKTEICYIDARLKPSASKK